MASGFWCSFSVALRPQKPYGLLGTWSPGRSPGLPHSSWAYWMSSSNSRMARGFFNVALRPQRPYGLLGTGSRGRPPRLSHISWTLRILDKTFQINDGEHCVVTSGISCTQRRQITLIWMLESGWNHRALHQSAQYNMAVRSELVGL